MSAMMVGGKPHITVHMASRPRTTSRWAVKTAPVTEGDCHTTLHSASRQVLGLLSGERTSHAPEGPAPPPVGHEDGYGHPYVRSWPRAGRRRARGPVAR